MNHLGQKIVAGISLLRQNRGMNLLKHKKAACIIGVAFLFSGLSSGCAIFETRPLKQMAYAEAAVQAATVANAESNPATISVFQLARDQLSRARSYYRLKNFKKARIYAINARRLAEEAEWKALRPSDGSKVDSLVKE